MNRYSALGYAAKALCLEALLSLLRGAWVCVRCF